MPTARRRDGAGCVGSPAARFVGVRRDVRAQHRIDDAPRLLNVIFAREQRGIALHGLGLYIYAGEDLPALPVADAANDEHKGAAAPTRPVEPPQPPRAVSPPRRPASFGDHSITLMQQRTIARVASEVGVDLPQLLAFFGVNELGEIPAGEFQRVMRSLEKRRAAA